MFNNMFFGNGSNSNVSLSWFPHYPRNESHASNDGVDGYIALLALAGFIGLSALCLYCCYQLRHSSAQSAAQNAATLLRNAGGASEVVVQSDPGSTLGLGS